MAWGSANLKYLNTYHVSAIGMWPHYNKYKLKIPKKYRVNNRNLYIKIVIEIFKTISAEIINSVGGVAIKKLGYFFVFRSHRKRIVAYSNEKGSGMFYNERKNSRYIEPMFFPSQTLSPSIDGWCMDDSYTKKVKDEVRAKVYEGFKYKNYAYSVSRFKLV